MNEVGQIERITQNRVIKLFQDELCLVITLLGDALKPERIREIPGIPAPWFCPRFPNCSPNQRNLNHLWESP